MKAVLVFRDGRRREMPTGHVGCIRYHLPISKVEALIFEVREGTEPLEYHEVGRVKYE